MIFIVCAVALATLNISKAVDENGKTIEPVVEFVDGLTRYLHQNRLCLSSLIQLAPLCSAPKPFICSITPKSAKAKALIVADERHD